jgi:hypothetical protein
LALPATLGYDAWAWTVWGRQLAHLDLATTAGPSFKPLPVLALAPLSLLGSATPVVWMGLMRAGRGAVARARLSGRRTAGRPAGRRRSPRSASALSADLYRTALLGSAEPVLIALTLGRRRSPPGRSPRLGARAHRAGRAHPPEAWVLLGGLRRLRVAARARACGPLAAAAVVLPPVLWLGMDWIGSGDPLHASSTGDLGHRGQRRERQGAGRRGRAPSRGRGHPSPR